MTLFKENRRDSKRITVFPKTPGVNLQKELSLLDQILCVLSLQVPFVLLDTIKSNSLPAFAPWPLQTWQDPRLGIASQSGGSLGLGRPRYLHSLTSVDRETC